MPFEHDEPGPLIPEDTGTGAAEEKPERKRSRRKSVSVKVDPEPVPEEPAGTVVCSWPDRPSRGGSYRLDKNGDWVLLTRTTDS